MLNGWQFLSKDDIMRIERGIVEGRVLGGPWHIELQPCNTCNLECFFCVSRGGRYNENLSWPLLKEFLIQNRRRDLRMLRLTGGGEPLAYPQIHELIDLCGEQGLLLEMVNTNGTLLAPLVDRMIESGINWITVSLNESDPQRYARTMRVSEKMYHRAIEGIQAVVEARQRHPAARRPRLWVQLFLWKGSAPYITQMYELARSLGVDTIIMRTLIASLNDQHLTERDRPMVESQLREIIAEDCRSGEYKLHFDLNQELDLHKFTWAEMSRHNPPHSENYPDIPWSFWRREFCYVGWYNTAINARGEVFPCFQYHEMPKRMVGNIHEATLDEIWRGAGYEAWRAQIREMMRLRGRMEPSDRYNLFVERKCTRCDKCHYIYNLATPDFYRRVWRDFRKTTSLGELVRARARNSVIHLAHRALLRPR